MKFETLTNKEKTMVVFSVVCLGISAILVAYAGGRYMYIAQEQREEKELQACTERILKRENIKKSHGGYSFFETAAKIKCLEIRRS